MFRVKGVGDLQVSKGVADPEMREGVRVTIVIINRLGIKECLHGSYVSSPNPFE